jgi:hypothetical protein
LVYYCTCQQVSKEKLQVASHKPIIWRIRGLGTPKGLLGVGVSRNALWEHHLLGGAAKDAQKHTQKTQLSLPARHLRPSSWSQAARKLWHTTNVRGATLKLKQTLKERFRLRGTQNLHLKVALAHDFIATSTGSAPFLPVSAPPIVGADTTSSYLEL